jgi:transposase
MPELGAIENKPPQASPGSLRSLGIPDANKGKRFIQGGRAGLPQAPYLPALVAARLNPVFKAKYDAFVQAGKRPKLGITAIMRKLIILANAILRDGRTWTNNAA